MFEYRFSILNERSRQMRVDRSLNEYSYFNQIIGNDSAVDALADLCFSGLSNAQHWVDENIMLVGPPSSGKTTLAKTVGKVLEVVFVCIDGTQIRKTDDIIEETLKSWSQRGVYLASESFDEVEIITLPTTLIFIDEIHALSKRTQEGLLKATERSDLMLFGKSAVLNCSNVCWMGATTDWGKLCGALQTRFRRVDVVAPTATEVELMVIRNFRVSSDEAKQLVFFGGLVPRETFAFCRAVQMCLGRGGGTFGEALEIVCRREGIDQWGMRRQRVAILRYLGDHSGALLRMLVQGTGLQKEELLDQWLPPLMNSGMVGFDGKYFLTPLGRGELKKRTARP
jgi:Holliday junction resolvasome RuvABC ATP-dependent DNA helicase subunit